MLSSLTWKTLARRNIKKQKRLVFRLKASFCLKTYFAFTLVQSQNSDQEKKVIFKVFIFWRYSKTLKETCNSLKKWTLNLWWISNITNHIEIRNFIKAPSFKSFLHLSYKKAHINLFMTVSFNIFLRQTLTDDFLGLHKNMNCAFPLITS